MCSQSEDGVAISCPARADHDGSDLAGELHGDRTDTTRSPVDQDGLAWPDPLTLGAPNAGPRRPSDTDSHRAGLFLWERLSESHPNELLNQGLR
jgi:hypothetical protein